MLEEPLAQAPGGKTGPPTSRDSTSKPPGPKQESPRGGSPKTPLTCNVSSFCLIVSFFTFRPLVSVCVMKTVTLLIEEAKLTASRDLRPAVNDPPRNSGVCIRLDHASPRTAGPPSRSLAGAGAPQQTHPVLHTLPSFGGHRVHSLAGQSQDLSLGWALRSDPSRWGVRPRRDQGLGAVLSSTLVHSGRLVKSVLTSTLGLA